MVQLMSSNSLSFSDLVLYVHLSVRETTQKQKEQPALGGSASQSQGGGDNYLFGLSWFRRVAVCLFLSSSGVEPCLPSGFEEQKRRWWRLRAVLEWGVGLRSTEDALDAGMGLCREPFGISANDNCVSEVSQAGGGQAQKDRRS